MEEANLIGQAEDAHLVGHTHFPRGKLAALTFHTHDQQTSLGRMIPDSTVLMRVVIIRI